MSTIDESTAFNTDELMLDDLELESLDTTSPTESIPDVTANRDLNFFRKIPVTVTLEVSSKEIELGELMQASAGSVIELEKLKGEPLDVKVNGSLMGHAEVVVVNNKYGMRIIDVLESPLDSMGN